MPRRAQWPQSSRPCRQITERKLERCVENQAIDWLRHPRHCISERFSWPARRRGKCRGECGDRAALTHAQESLREGNTFFFFISFTQARQSSGLQSNTKARSAAVHYKQLLAVGPEKLHAVGTEKRHGVTETYKALPRENIFRTLNVVERNASK